MSDGAERQSHLAIAAVDVDLAGERLLEAIASACDPAAAFPAQVDAALRAAFTFSAVEPDRARALLDHNRSEDVLLYETGWRSTFADRLRAAAKRQSDLASPPLFLEPFLICEVEERLCCWLQDGQDQPLGDCVRDQREFILGYYPPRAQLTNGSALDAASRPASGGT